MKYVWSVETAVIFKQFEHQNRDTTYSTMEHRLGVEKLEPMYVIADNLIRWAKAHAKQNGALLGTDYYSKEGFVSIAYGVLHMASSQGVVALEKGLTRDSKDNSVLSHLINKACELAGIAYEELYL